MISRKSVNIKIEKDFQIGNISSSEDFSICKRLPHAVIIGVNKCGTITLETFLSYHPNIISAGEQKFFEGRNQVQTKELYVEHMPPISSEMKLIAKSVGAIWYKDDVIKVLQRHRELMPNLKMLLIVKDPIKRVVSDIVHHYSIKTYKNYGQPYNVNDIILDFELRDKVFHLSNYSRIWSWLTTVFEEDQILVLDGDEFREKPVLILQKIEHFLETPAFFSKKHFDYTARDGFPCFKLNKRSASQCMGGNKGRAHPELNEESLDYLREYFKPILEDFQKQTGMKLRL